MAINTTFTSGAILTAAQMNNLPWGVALNGKKTTSDTGATLNTETTIVTGSITAVTGRLYRMTYFEPNLYASAVGSANMRIKDGAAELAQTYIYLPAASQETNGIVTVVTTLSAGAHTISATIVRGSPITLSAIRSATSYAVFTVEDIGPS